MAEAAIMRSAGSAGDFCARRADATQTSGVNKRGLLTGEHAKPAPEPGALKSEQPKPEAKPARRPRAIAELANPSVAPKPNAAPPRVSVEMIEGAKKRNVDFP